VVGQATETFVFGNRLTRYGGPSIRLCRRRFVQALQESLDNSPSHADSIPSFLNSELLEYIKAQSTITPATDGRMTVIGSVVAS
jgi:hypothetical protein